MIVGHQVWVPRIPDTGHARGAPGKIEGDEFQLDRHGPDSQHNRTEECPELHSDDRLPASSVQEAGVGEHGRDNLDDDANPRLGRGKHIPIIDRVSLRLEPESECWLLNREARLDEEVAERQDPKLPLCHDAQNLLLVPRGWSEHAVAISHESCFGQADLGLCEIESARRLGKVGIEEISHDADGKTDGATNDEQPLPSRVPEMAIEIVVRRGLQVAAEHPGQRRGAIEEGDALGALLFGIPGTNQVDDAREKGTFAQSDQESQSIQMGHAGDGRAAES